MKKSLIIFITIFFFACSEDKNSVEESDVATKASSANNWFIRGGSDTYSLGDRLGIRVSTTEEDYGAITNVTIEMKTANNPQYVTLYSRETSSLEISDLYAFKLGTCTLRGTVWTEFGSRDTEEFEFRVLGPPIERLIEREDIKSSINSCWGSAKSSEANGSRCEYGFTIQMKLECDKEPIYSTLSATGPVNSSCDSGANNEINLSIEDRELNEGAEYSVGWFHAHPPISTCPSTTCRGTGPSGTDVNSANSSNMPSAVADYSDFTICGGHSTSGSYTIYYAGSHSQRL